MVDALYHCLPFAPLRLCASILSCVLLSSHLWAVEPPHARFNSLGMRFVRVPAGSFLMGSADDDPQADPDERPQHRVTISRDFYLGATEITQSEYAAVMGRNPSWFSADGGGRDDVRGIDVGNHPVDMVTWDEAVEFCRRLSDLKTERDHGRSYRLPTEAEWEYAARAGTTTLFAFGDRLTVDQANVRDAGKSTGRTRAVASYRSNAFGLYDLHGNVWEWTADRYDAAAYLASTAVDPSGPGEGTGRVVRGGDYRFDARQARSANRDFTRASRRDQGNGFRIVLEVGGQRP